jgi:hypothetical protein
MKGFKKGIAPEVYVAFTILIILIVLGTIIVGIFFPVKEVNIEFIRDSYAMINALKTARLFTETSLDFSVYQTIYNNSRYGGYFDISQLPPERKMTNELFPKCINAMSKFEGCKPQHTKHQDKKIFEGMKYEGEKYIDTYPVGLLQCILSNLRNEKTGEIYYGLKKDDIKQIDCDFKDVTEKAVKGFQEDNGLPSTGVVDKQTIEKLKEVFVSKWGDCSKFFDDCEDNIRTLVVWEPQSPDENKIIEELKKGVANEMAKYTKDYYNFMEYYVQLPNYPESKIEIKNQPSFLNVSINSDDMFSITSENFKEIEKINLKISPEISKNYPIRYIDLYRLGREIYNDISNKLAGKKCEDFFYGDKIYHKKDISGFVVDAEIFDKKSSNLIVRVHLNEVTKPYPIFNGKDTSFEYIKLEFLIKLTCT